MAEKTPWWKTAFIIRRRGGSSSKDPGPIPQETSTGTQSVGATTPATHSNSSTDSSDNSRLIKNETPEDRARKQAFTERRLLTISRSGRFKENRRKRVNVLENNNLYDEDSAAKSQEGFR